MNPGSGAMRIARGGVLAVACLLLAVSGHLGGGGHLPPLPAVLVAGVLIGAVFAVLADKRRGTGQLIVASVGAQALFHATFVLAGHDLHGVPFLGPRALESHVLASILVAVLAARADALLWSLVELITLARVPSLAVVPAAHVPVAGPLPGEPALRRVRLAGDACPRRGPPPC
jgi:hypothetical protein